MLIEAAVPKLAIEAFDEGVLDRLPWLNEGQGQLPLTGPEEHRFTGQLWPVIATNRGRQRALLSVLFQERIKRRIYSTQEAAKSDVFDYIEMFYNPRPRHSTSEDLSPAEY